MESIASEKKRVVMVLGMARCGTSTITRGIQAAGVTLSDNLHLPDERNPKGFWEDVEINYKINRGVLRALDFPWLCNGLEEALQAGTNVALNAYRRFAVRLVGEKLAGTRCWGFKDVNTVLILPFWQAVLKDAGVSDHYVIALRNPLGCAYSNIKHSQLELEAGLLAWLRGMVLAVEGSHGRERMVVSYDKVLEDPSGELCRMHRLLAMSEPLSTKELDAYAGEFVDKNLHHHAYSEADIAAHPAIQAVPLCASVYSLLMRVANDELAFTDAEFHAAWLPIRREFERLYPLYNHIHLIQQACHRLEKRIRKVNQSVSWRAFMPLRKLRHVMRGGQKWRRS